MKSIALIGAVITQMILAPIQVQQPQLPAAQLNTPVVEVKEAPCQEWHGAVIVTRSWIVED